jgi:TPR repeat protein
MKGEASMARYEMTDPATAGLGEAPATADTLLALGMMYASGRSVPIDLVAAHKWFNLAAMKGCAEAVERRREIAAEMTDSEIGQAQRAARDWLKQHPQTRAAPKVLAAAA